MAVIRLDSFRLPTHLPPPFAGEGGPCVSRGRERGAPYPASSLPSPDPLRGPPSPAGGRGKRWRQYTSCW
ncbi:hypothetical protein FV230_10710 [Methylobacterium sp. WL6]|nr:hypothetical protein FV230_10710 [Methylobacterium sp. WL6]